VVSIYDVGAAHDVVPDYIVMELVTGETLRDLLRREGKLTTELAARLMKEICVGVGAAHTAGIIHRDLKPENVIVQPNGQVKILDFGLAKLREMASEKTENQLTKAGTILGTYRYMSPEQWGEREPDSRSDVYSLGAMLYEMLSGNSPFEANSMEGYVAKHLMETPNPFGRNLAIPTNIERIVFRCLEKKPDDRPNDANALLNELNQLSFASDPEATVIRQAPPKNLPLMQTIKAEITNQTNLANQTISYVSQGIDTIKTHAPQVWKVFLATMTSSLAAPTLSLCVTTLMTLIFSDGTELQVAVYFTLFYFVLTPIFTLLSLMLAPKLLSLPTLKFGKLFLTGFKIGIALTLFSFFVSILSVLITNSFSLDSDKIRRHPLSIVLPFLISVVILSPWIFFELRNAFSVMQTEISLNSPGKN
jgi:serine/threonine protein kinase